VILVLALTTVILGLIGMALHVHLGVADKSRGQVEEARLARTLLQRIAEDIRNSVPFTPTSAGGTATSSGSDTSDTSTASGTTTSATVIPSGISGTAQCLQMDTTRRVRPTGAAADANGNTASLIPMSDVKTVAYSLGNPGTTAPTERGDASPGAQEGLYRREVDRAAYTCAMQQGQADLLSQVASLLAPEVVNLQFTYYDGKTTSDTWDSNTNGKLPTAVKVTIMIRRAAGKSSPAVASMAADNSAFAVYEMLIDLPNAPTQSGQSAGGTTTTP